jgi:predicted Zn-dependent protease
LPGGKVAVFSGLLPVAEENGRLNDDQLATVMSHEIAHALAHHASERIARQQKYQRALEAVNGALGDCRRMSGGTSSACCRPVRPPAVWPTTGGKSRRRTTSECSS